METKINTKTKNISEVEKRVEDFPLRCKELENDSSLYKKIFKSASIREILINRRSDRSGSKTHNGFRD